MAERHRVGQVKEGSSGFAPAVQDTFWDYFYDIQKALMAIPVELRREIDDLEDFKDFLGKHDRGLARKFEKAYDDLYEDEYLYEHEGYRSGTMDAVVNEELEQLFGRRAEKTAAASVAARYAASNGPVHDVLTDEWNKLHDVSDAIESTLGTYDQAASYRGAAGESDAQAVIKATREAVKALGKTSLMFGRLMKAEQSFVKKHGHPDEYIHKTQTEFGFR